MATHVESGPAPASRPTGTVTFLFSDIEGSTSRWEANREAMSLALARHDALMRAAIEQHGGYVFKTIGDAFCAAFATPPQALGAAIDAQRALRAEDFSSVDGLRVRAALHTGFADERDGDYFGPAVNRVARLLAIGHGGQVLVSGTATDLLQDAMPPQSSLRDLGAHRLKDLARPEQVYQLVAADLPETFPPLRSLDELPKAVARDLQLEVGLALSLHPLAAVAALRPSREAEHARGDRMRAARLLGYVDARLTALDALREYTEQQQYDRMLAVLRDALGEDELSKLMDEGRAWSEDQAISEAMLV